MILGAQAVKSVPATTPKKKGDQTLPKVLQDWLSGFALKDNSTMRSYGTAVISRALPILSRLGSVHEIGPVEAQRTLAEIRKGYSTATVNQTASALSSLWDEMIRQRIVDSNPWKQVRRHKPKTRVGEKVLTEEEVQALIKAAPVGLNRTLIRFLYATGARISEVIMPPPNKRESGHGLRWRDLRPGSDGWYMATLLGKGDKTRTVGVQPSMMKDLRQLPGQHRPDDYLFPIARSSAWRIIRRAAQAAGLGRDASPHWLRHTHAVHARRHGVLLEVLQKSLGHARLDTTQVYVEVDPGLGSAAHMPDWFGEE